MQIGSTVVYKASTPGGLRGGPESNVTPVVGLVTDIHPNGELTLYAIHRDSTRFIHAVPAGQCEEVIDLFLYTEVINLRKLVTALAEQLESLTAPSVVVMESTEKGLDSYNTNTKKGK